MYETMNGTGDPTLPGHPDPYPHYARLRQKGPVHWNEAVGGWLLCCYADAEVFLHQHGRLSRAAYIDGLAAKHGDGPILRAQRRELAFMDPPAHHRLRHLLGKAFTPHTIEAMRPHVGRIVDEMLDRVAGRRSMDVIADLAYPLPSVVVSEMLGIPEGDRARLQGWVDGLVTSRGVVRTEAMIEAGNRSTEAFTAYLHDLVPRRAASPGSDLLSALIAAEEGGERMTQEQIVGVAQTLFAAGHATTRNVIGNGLLALLRHPAAHARLRAEPALIGPAVEEMLRYDSPTQSTSPFVVTEAIEVGGQTIKAGQSVSILLGAVNRDPAQFPGAEEFDVARTPNAHLAFSTGMHVCLGASLARLEAQVAILRLLQRMPNLVLADGDLEWQANGRFRGLKALPVTI
jgi:cytochrome P450